METNSGLLEGSLLRQCWCPHRWNRWPQLNACTFHLLLHLFDYWPGI